MKKIKFCPKCGSNKIVKKISSSLVFGIPQPWKCEKCGFQSEVFPETNEKNFKLIQKEFNKKKK